VTDELKTAAEVAGTGAGIGGVTGVLRMVILGQPGGLPAYLSILAASVLVGMLAGLMASSVAIEGAPLSERMQWAIIIVAGLVAKDFLTGLRAIGIEFASDPLALIIRIIKAIRGH
jgi:hypothetical protein